MTPRSTTHLTAARKATPLSSGYKLGTKSIAGQPVPMCAVFGLFDSTREGSGYLSHAGLADEDHTLGVHSSRWFHIWPTTSATFYGGDHDFTRPDLIGYIDESTI